MEAGRTEQFEGIRSCIFQNEDKPWKQRDSSNSRKFAKKTKHKRERRRPKLILNVPMSIGNTRGLSIKIKETAIKQQRSESNV